MHDPAPIESVTRGIHASWLRWILIAATLVLSVVVYLTCIHLLGFPDGHISTAQRIRRGIAYALLVVNGVALLVYASTIVGAGPRHWRRLLAVHALLVAILAALILYHSGSTPDV